MTDEPSRRPEDIRPENAEAYAGVFFTTIRRELLGSRAQGVEVTDVELLGALHDAMVRVTYRDLDTNEVRQVAVPIFGDEMLEEPEVEAQAVVLNWEAGEFRS